jgi:hypothetical protein
MTLSKNISGSPAKFHDDYVWNGEALPASTSKTSEASAAGSVQGALELVVEADADIVLGSGVTKGLALEVLASETEGGTYSSVATLIDVAKTDAAKTLSAGEIARYAPPSGVGPYFKLKATADGDLSGSTVTAYPAYIPR